MALSLAIDHVVVAVGDLDQAAADFRRLGFTLTPRGHHSIGSQNHCIMFSSTYIELLCAPTPHAWLDYYRAFVARGDGLAAVALAASDVDAASRELPGANAPMDLSRPVEGGVARFRLVQIDSVPYLFVCQHLTRELVWRAEWQNPGDIVGVALPMRRPLDGLPASIEWEKPPLVRIRGEGQSADTHGVRLEFV